jgi:hypothetical protein
MQFFFNLDAKWGWVVNATPWPLYFRETDTLHTIEEAVWAPVTVWTGAENLSPTRILSRTVQPVASGCIV